MRSAPMRPAVASISGSLPSTAAQQLRRKYSRGVSDEVGRVGVAVLRVVPLDAREQAGHPGVLRFEKPDAQLRMELEHAADDHGDQRLLHLDPVAGHVTVEAVLAVEHVMYE